MLLSLVGERFRMRHDGLNLALAFKRLPKIATTLRKLSRFKYGVAGKQTKLGNAPDFVETLCGIEFICYVDSSQEQANREKRQTLEERIVHAIEVPRSVDRYGVLSLGLSDDAVNDISLCQELEGDWYRLLPRDTGTIELPVWVDHVGSAQTRWRRYQLEEKPVPIVTGPDGVQWKWTRITAQQQME
jgi:CRISPR-associated protein Cas5t